MGPSRYVADMAQDNPGQQSYNNLLSSQVPISGMPVSCCKSTGISLLNPSGMTVSARICAICC